MYLKYHHVDTTRVSVDVCMCERLFDFEVDYMVAFSFTYIDKATNKLHIHCTTVVGYNDNLSTLYIL
jgi:hypothetical protein